MTSPSLSACEVARLLKFSIGAEAASVVHRLDGFLPSLASALERRGLDPDLDDVPTCSEFRFLREIRESLAEAETHSDSRSSAALALC